MAKKKNKNNNKKNNNKINKIRLMRFIVNIVVSLIIVALAVKFLRSSSYFNIEKIVCSDQEKQERIKKILNLKEKNIFSLDLKAISEMIKDEYPETARIIVSRVFPDKLLIDLEERIPVAKFKLSKKTFFIDQEAIVLGYPKNYDKLELATLKGLNIGFKNLNTGQKLRSKNLTLALNLLKQINDIPLLEQYKVVELDISNLNKISFTIHKETVVLIRRADFSRKLNILISLLMQLESELEEINYIDLRFNDPVIKKK